MAHQRKPSLGLVDYSDSDKSDEEDTKPVPSDLPPLPSKFHDLYTTAPRLTKEDDPSAHGGRHRAIPHVEGNWPTHLYFEWHLTNPELAKIGRLIDIGRDVIAKHVQFHRDEKFRLESFLYSDLGTRLPLHISMSRPIVLRTEERDQFMAQLEKAVGGSGVQGFKVQFTSLEWVPNQDRTRWFWVMRATGPVQQRQTLLGSLLTTCNQVVRSHNQPGLYLTDSRGGNSTREGFHVSIGWSLTEPSKDLCEGISAAITSNDQTELSDLTMACETLKVKIGNVVHAVELGRAF